MKIIPFAIMTILLTAGCACPKSQIEKKWQAIIESRTAAEEQKNVVEFHEKCMKNITLHFEVKDSSGNITAYNPTGNHLQQSVSVRLIATKDDKQYCETDFWQPKNIENFYYLFNE
jgi:predicted component of type VI protein secretion system